MLTIYKASAGSGKTYTLAFQYIRELVGIKNPETGRYRLNLPKYSSAGTEVTNRHRGILAITFTNKATEEMKHRIIDKLHALAVMPQPGRKDADYADRLCEEFGCNRVELAEASGKALRQLLFDYHNFNISTIDSFFQRVLRTFARELDRQGDFSVEMNDEFVIQSAVGMLLDDFNYGGSVDNEFGKWLFSYLTSQIEEGKKTTFLNRKSNAHTALVALVSRISKETFKPYGAAMRSYLCEPKRLGRLASELSKRRAQILRDLRIMANDAVDALNASGCGLQGFNPVLTRLIADNFLKQVEPEKKDIFDTAAVRNAISDTDPKVVVKKYFKGSDADQAVIAGLFSQAYAMLTEYFDLSMIRTNLSQLGLLAYAWRYLDRFYAENNTVLLSDTNDILRRIIDGSEMPFIYERLGVQLHHFLIDEFQDTSVMQWDNLRPLVGNGLSEKFDSLIIGDEKQSIYRFRNSAPELLHTKVANEDFPDNSEVRGASENENTNYRSSAEVVRFNNTLFSILARNWAVAGYENVVQAIPPHHLDFKGYVHFIPKSQWADDEPLHTMARQILRQCDPDQGNYRWRDIAILVARRDEGAEAIDFLMENYPDIPVLSDEALLLKKSTAVQLVISLLRMIDSEYSVTEPTGQGDPKYPTSGDVTMMMSRFEYFRDLGFGESEALERALRPARSESEQRLNDIISRVRSHKPSSLSALVETVITEQLTADERSNQIAYLSAFQDYVLEYSQRYNPSVHSFLEWWDSKGANLSIPASEGIDAVRVMTIHKSKGLEFECVHIPYGSWAKAGRPRGKWIEFPAAAGFDPEICPPVVYMQLEKQCLSPTSWFHDVYVADEAERVSDTLNMTYVAYTRAVSELVVYYDPGSGMGKDLKEAFGATAPSAGPYTIGLRDYCSSDGGLLIGSPTRSRRGEDASSDAIAIGYPVYFRDDTKVLTSVEDMLELDRDITDDTADEDDAERYQSPQEEEGRLRGLLLHDVMGRVRAVGDIERAVAQAAKSARLTREQSAELLGFVTKLLDLDNPMICRWFCDYDRVLMEQPIYIPNLGKTKRPDRIIFCPDGSVDVVDYKFTTEEQPEHHDQVRIYMGLMRDMGHSDVRGFLWYPLRDGSPIIPVPNEKIDC